MQKTTHPSSSGRDESDGRKGCSLLSFAFVYYLVMLVLLCLATLVAAQTVIPANYRKDYFLPYDEYPEYHQPDPGLMNPEMNLHE